MTTNTPFRFVIITLLLTATACDLFIGEDDEDVVDTAPSVSEVEEPDSALPAEEAPEDAQPTEDEPDEPPLVASDSSLSRDFALPLPLFAPDSAWNQRADNAVVLPESDAQILVLYRVLLGDISSLQGYDEPATNWPYMDVGIDDFTVPIFRAGEGEQQVWICQDDGIVGWAHPKFGIETEGGPVTVPAPAGTVRPAGPENDGADGWLVLYDPATFTSYDYIGATPYRDEECRGFQGGLIGEQILQAGVVDFFDVRGPGANSPGASDYSARAFVRHPRPAQYRPRPLRAAGIRLLLPGLHHRDRLLQYGRRRPGLWATHPPEANPRGRRR